MNENKIRNIVIRAIQEDIWTGDITTDCVVKEDKEAIGKIIFKEEGVLAGLPVARMVFKEIDSDLKFNALIEEGETINADRVVAKVAGRTKSILKGERVALNFLQRLSGIATQTKRYVDGVEEFDVKIVDTRKTTPNLRILEKYAVRKGGGNNHRMGLYDVILIKDNHIRSAGGIKEAIQRTKDQYATMIEVEVETIEDVNRALDAGADIIMLDNMDIPSMKKAVNLISERAKIEASGGITLKNIKEVASTGVDVISVGALTHQISSLDISLDLAQE